MFPLAALGALAVKLSLIPDMCSRLKIQRIFRWYYCYDLFYRQNRMGNLLSRPRPYHSDRERDIHDGNDSLLFHDLCVRPANLFFRHGRMLSFPEEIK